MPSADGSQDAQDAVTGKGAVVNELVDTLAAGEMEQGDVEFLFVEVGGVALQGLDDGVV